MIKHRIMSAATLLGGVVFTGHAVAQSPEVARRLDAKYDVVWPAADGLIRVNKGGYRIPSGSWWCRRPTTMPRISATAMP